MNEIWCSLIRDLLENKKPDYHSNEATVIRFLSCDFGNPAIPVGPVAFRPTITRGLALSQNMIQSFLCCFDISNFNAKNN